VFKIGLSEELIFLLLFMTKQRFQVIENNISKFSME
jgi:hypothetical protein